MNAPITTLDSYRLLGRSGVRGSLMPLGTMTPGSDQRWGATDPDRQDVVAVGVVHFVVPDGLPGPLSWIYELPEGLHVISGTADILGGLGLILPGLSGIRPGLTVGAAAGLLVAMIAAAPWHLGRGEVVNVLINLALVGLLGLLAYGRARRSPLPGSFGAPAA
jgi:uncharacterized membrane protein